MKYFIELQLIKQLTDNLGCSLRDNGIDVAGCANAASSRKRNVIEKTAARGMSVDFLFRPFFASRPSQREASEPEKRKEFISSSLRGRRTSDRKTTGESDRRRPREPGRVGRRDRQRRVERTDEPRRRAEERMGGGGGRTTTTPPPPPPPPPAARAGPFGLPLHRSFVPRQSVARYQAKWMSS